jgi:hypothetical protein
VIESHTTSEAAIQDAVDAAQEPLAGEALPPGVVDWLARIRLLEGVPFAYLVPHEEMLPRESIRFFYLNRNWTDAAVDGALSLAASTRDRAFLESVYADLRAAVDAAERNLWAERTGAPLQDGAADVITGFLLRSQIVSGWPGLAFRASRDEAGTPVPVRLLRVERLAPAVMLVMVDGIPDRIEIEEPRGAAQLGVDTATGAPTRRTVTMRDPATGKNLPGTGTDVPFREGSPGVIDVKTLRDRMVARNRPEIGPDMSPAEFALQLVQYPARQAFTNTGAMPDVFRATIPISVVRASHEEG